MKRYDLGWDWGEGRIQEDSSGDYVKHADHLAFAAQVREVAEGMLCAPDCDSRRPGHMVGGISFDVNNPPRAHEVKHKCTCPRGRLLAMCGEVT